jgi:hypothetical protein
LLGDAHNIGQAMNYYILPLSCIPIVRSSIQPVTSEEWLKDTVMEELKELDTAIQNKYHSAGKEDIPDYFSHYTPQFDPMEEDLPEADTWDPKSFDKYISAQILLPKPGTEDQDVIGTVICRKRDIHGNPIGRATSNPILDTRIYQVELPDGHIEEFSAKKLRNGSIHKLMSAFYM